MGSKLAGQRRVRVGAVVAAALLGVGMITACGNEGAEPEPKDWSEGEDQQGKGNGQKQRGNEKPDKPKDPEEYAFVKKYIEEGMYPARTSGDTSKLLEMSTDDCEGCQVMADQYDEMAENGGEHRGDPVEEVLDLVDGPKGSDPVTIRVKTKLNEVEFIPEKGDQPRPIGGTAELREFELISEGGKWKVSNFCGVAEDQPSGCP